MVNCTEIIFKGDAQRLNVNVFLFGIYIFFNIAVDRNKGAGKIRDKQDTWTYINSRLIVAVSTGALLGSSKINNGRKLEMGNDNNNNGKRTTDKCTTLVK